MSEKKHTETDGIELNNEGDVITLFDRRVDKPPVNPFYDRSADPFAYPETLEEAAAAKMEAEKWFRGFERRLKRRNMVRNVRCHVLEFFELVSAFYLATSALVLVATAVKGLP